MDMDVEKTWMLATIVASTRVYYVDIMGPFRSGLLSFFKSVGQVPGWYYDPRQYLPHANTYPVGGFR